MLTEQLKQLESLSPELQQRLLSAMARELKSIGDEESRAAWQSRQADLEHQFQERLRQEYQSAMQEIPRGIDGIDARRAIRRRFRQRGYEPEAPETGVERLRRERREWAQQQQPATTFPVVGSGGETSESLLEEYRNLTRNIPPGEAGVDARFKAKLAIRTMAEDAGIQSPV